MTRDTQRQLGSAVLLSGVILMVAWLAFVMPLVGSIVGLDHVGTFYRANSGSYGIFAYGLLHLGPEVSNLYFLAAILSVLVGKLAFLLIMTGLNINDEVKEPKVTTPEPTPSSRRPAPYRGAIS